jgi:chemotaxis-related protein WspD
LNDSLDNREAGADELAIAETPSTLLPGSLASPAEVNDCWNKIGVAGDGSCAELAKFAHCRNCPVYSAAGALLLERNLPTGYRRDWTEYFSRDRKPVAPGKMSAVVFRIGAEWLALATRTFQEVAERRTIRPLPHRQQKIVLGLVNVRGELLVCVSIGRLLGIENGGQPGHSQTMCDRLVVVEWQGNRFAFPVDEIQGIHRYNPEDLKEAPATVAKAGSSFTRGVLTPPGRSIGCLDEELLFSILNRSLS